MEYANAMKAMLDQTVVNVTLATTKMERNAKVCCKRKMIPHTIIFISPPLSFSLHPTAPCSSGTESCDGMQCTCKKGFNGTGCCECADSYYRDREDLNNCIGQYK